MKDNKKSLVICINKLKEEEADAKKHGNHEMASGITLSRVLVEEMFRNIYGEIPITITNKPT